MDNDEWRETRRDANRAGRFGVGWIVAIVVIVGLLGAGAWGISVLTAGVRGEGDKIVEKSSADNFIESQAYFEDHYAEYQATLVKIDIASTALSANPDDRTLQTNLTGVQSHCTNVVAEYNAEARKYLSEDFRSADLPGKLDAQTCVE